MTRTEISGRALIPVPTRPSSATTKSASDPVNGSADPPPGTEPCLSSTVDELRKTLAKLRRLSPAHVDGACGNLDAALHGLVWACSNVNAVLHDIDVEISDCHLSETLLLRATPLASSLLSDVGSVDDRTYAHIVGQLLEVCDEYAPAIFRQVAEELRDVASLDVVRPPRPIAFSPLPKSSAHRFPRKTSLAFRRGQRVLTMENLPKVAVSSRKPDEPEEHNLAFLFERVNEDPDFPIVPIWHEDSVAQRARLDYISRLPEDPELGYFDHAILINKILIEFEAFSKIPSASSLLKWRFLALNGFTRIMDREVAVAERCEPNRLLRAKIEHLLPTTRLAKQKKALRCIELGVLRNAGVLELSDGEVKDLLWTETRNCLGKFRGTMDPNQEYICDLISEYSNDTPSDYFVDPETIASDCNEVKRASIANWAANIEAPRYTHANLYKKKGKERGRLEPNYNCKDLIWAEIAHKFKYFRPRIDLKEFVERSKPALSPAEDFPDARSEGHYTNMLPDVSVGTLSSDPVKGDSKALEDWQTSVEVMGSATKVEDTSNGHQICQFINISSSDSILGEYPDDAFAANTPAANDTSDPSENGKSLGHHVRHMNTLRMAHDGPYRAHGPEQPGYRGYTHSRPAPDWDAPGVVKPEYAQPKKSKKLGALDRFNVVFEANERRARKIAMSVHEEAQAVQDGNDVQPSRRPRYTGSGAIYNEPAPKFKVNIIRQKESFDFGTGNATDLWPPHRPLYASRDTTYNNPPPMFAAAPARRATAPEYETGTMDSNGHVSLPSLTGSTSLQDGLSPASDDIFGSHNAPVYETAITEVNSHGSLPNQDPPTSPDACLPLDSGIIGDDKAFLQFIRQPGCAPRTPPHRILTTKAVIEWEYTPEAESVDEFF